MCGLLRPKTWWLAQNKFYGLSQAKSTPIGTLRSKLEDALRTPNAIRIPEQILNLEAEGNRKYRELYQLVLQETQSAKKGPAKAAKGATSTSVPALASKGPLKPLARKGSAKSKNVARGAMASTSISSAPEPPSSRTKVTAKKTTEGKAPAPKRNRSPDDVGGTSSSKRKRTNAEDGVFRFLTGTYKLSSPETLQEWGHVEEFVKDDFTLVVTLDSEGQLFGTFYFGICRGVLRSTSDIKPRADGAIAEVEWCGRELGDWKIVPPEPGMTGVLIFTRRKRDGRHTVKLCMGHMYAIGKFECAGEKVDEAMAISEEWEDYDWESYHAEEYVPGKWP